MNSGPTNARIAIIGEAPGAEEIAAGAPFVGASGRLLSSILEKAGIVRSSCFITNVCQHRPPGNDIGEWLSDNKLPPDPTWLRIRDKWVHPYVAEGINRLSDVLLSVKPTHIFALGNTALWALTGKSGIQKWRGSRLEESLPWGKGTIIPSLHPAAALREMSLAPVILSDAKRLLAIFEGRQKPRSYDACIIEPSFSQAKTALLRLLEQADFSKEPLLLSADLETRAYHIACLGLSWSPENAICIPFLKVDSSSPFYWPEEEESLLVNLISQLLLHPNINWVGQNFLYDCQYFHRFWGVVPLRVWDTMIGHHSIFSNTRKGLDYLSSIYARDHIYWKDEIKEWDPSIGERQYWLYNCKDACVTWEIWHEIQSASARHCAGDHFLFQQSLFHPVLRMMNRGIRLDSSQRLLLRRDLQSAAAQRQDNLDFMAGHPLNPKSPAQLKKFFHTDLRLPGIRSMTGDSLTLNSPALAQIAERTPALHRVCQTIAELRSIGVFLSTFINAESDSDGRMRCAFSIAGPTTFRFSSSENAFGSGMNLQNIPVAEKVKVKSKDYIHLPNVRKLFIPDDGFMFFDMDLDRADLQVVVWEASDDDLKWALRSGIDLHCLNACAIFDIKGIPPDELSESHPNYRDHRARITEPLRNKAKTGVHATNYGVGDYKLAQSLGITVREASLFRARWFSAHPGILSWHRRVEAQAREKGFVQNAFGARLHVLGRFDLPECLAWIPQSTVARIINQALLRIDAAEQAGKTSIQLLLQVHDSLGGQFLISHQDSEVALLRELGRVVVPYPDPLVIPVGINTSTQSWGHCK